MRSCTSCTSFLVPLGRRLEQAQFNIVNAVKIRRDLGQLPRFSLEVFVVAAAGGLVAVLTWMGIPSSRLILYAAFFLAAMFRLIPSVSRMQYNLILVRGMLYVFERLCDDIGTIPAENILPAPDAPDVHFEHELNVEHVTFRYAPDRPAVFEDFSMSVKRLECVAVVGPTGSGKSTLIDLVMGFLKPESGRVTVDGADIRSNLRSWRGRIGYVPQDICLFDDTVRANVAFGVEPGRIDDARVKKALELAQIADFVESLPDKLNTRLGEFGARISGGQKQRIAIARALYSGPELLILDEATSALDDDTEIEQHRAELSRAKITPADCQRFPFSRISANTRAREQKSSFSAYASVWRFSSSRRGSMSDSIFTSSSCLNGLSSTVPVAFRTNGAKPQMSVVSTGSPAASASISADPADSLRAGCRKRSAPSM